MRYGTGALLPICSFKSCGKAARHTDFFSCLLNIGMVCFFLARLNGFIAPDSAMRVKA